MSCASSWFFFTRLYRDARSTKHKIWEDLPFVLTLPAKCSILYQNYRDLYNRRSIVWAFISLRTSDANWAKVHHYIFTNALRLPLSLHGSVSQRLPGSVRIQSRVDLTFSLYGSSNLQSCTVWLSMHTAGVNDESAFWEYKQKGDHVSTTEFCHYCPSAFKIILASSLSKEGK